MAVETGPITGREYDTDKPEERRQLSDEKVEHHRRLVKLAYFKGYNLGLRLYGPRKAAQS